MTIPHSCVGAVFVFLAGCSCAKSVENPWHDPLKVEVTEVVDGDTFHFDPPLDIDGTEYEKVRLPCIDAPENTSETECWGPEASDFLRDWIEGKEVTLLFGEEADVTYDRVVANVQFHWKNVSIEMAEKGHARAYRDGWFDQSACCDEVKAAEDEARDKGRGGWGECDDAHWTDSME